NKKHVMINRIIIPISFLLMLFFTFPAESLAQNTRFNITGKVVDDEMGAALEYATVAITKPNDPDFIDGVVTDLEGNFSIPVAAGTYNIIVEYISFETKRFNNRQVNADLNLGTIVLGMSAASLDEVVV